MRKIIFALMCAACAAWAADMPRSEWHAKVGDCAQDPALLKQTIGQLSAADQTAFLAEVNDAIAKMPGSDEVRAARFLEANRAAVSGATPANRTAVLAEVFATVPPEYLTIINESFASDLFNRNANVARPFTDKEYVEVATKAMEAIVARCATAEHSAVRAAFAVLMFERASGGSPEGLRDALVAKLPESAQEAARSEWLPAAMGEGREKSYDPMLGVSEAGDEPNHAAVLRLTAKESGLALLQELQSGDSGAADVNRAFLTEDGTTLVDIGLSRVPRAAVFGDVPTGLIPVRDSSGNVMISNTPGITFGKEMYYGENGKIVYKTVDSNGNTVFMDENGVKVVGPAQNSSKKRGGKEGKIYVVPPAGSAP